LEILGERPVTLSRFGAAPSESAEARRQEFDVAVALLDSVVERLDRLNGDTGLPSNGLGLVGVVCRLLQRYGDSRGLGRQSRAEPLLHPARRPSNVLKASVETFKRPVQALNPVLEALRARLHGAKTGVDAANRRIETPGRCRDPGLNVAHFNGGRPVSHLPVLFLRPLQLTPDVLAELFPTPDLAYSTPPNPSEEPVRRLRHRPALTESRHVVDDPRRGPRRALNGSLLPAAVGLSGHQ